MSQQNSIPFTSLDTFTKYRFLFAFLISLTVIALEILWTRLLSAEYYYTFAFLILSMTILGLGLGGLALRFIKRLNHPDAVPWITLLAGVFALGGPPAVVQMNIEFSELFANGTMLLKSIGAVYILGSSFFLLGIVLALLFKSFHAEMPKLYTFDLVGAGTGVLLSVLLMNLIGTPITTIILVWPLLVMVGLMLRKWLRVIPLFLWIGSILMFNDIEFLLERPVVDRAPVIYRHWDAMAKIKIYEFDKEYRGINIDNMANTPLQKFDGNWNRPDSLRFQFNISVEWLMRKMPSCTFLSLGAGGGMDVLQALQENCSDIHAVEVNPHINNLMREGDIADFTGQIYKDPRVKVITEDARAYIRRFENKFDIIYSLSSNTFAALASGSFAMAENYLFTTEAFKDYYRALSPRGYLAMEHQFYIPRCVSQAKKALKESGIEHPENHIAVYNFPTLRRNLILIGKQPLTDSVRNNALGPIGADTHKYFHLLYPASDSTLNNTVDRLMKEGWETVQTGSITDVSPSSDDRPFVAQMGLWKNFSFDALNKISLFEHNGFPLAKTIIIFILLFITVMIIPLNFIPYLLAGNKLKLNGWLYFFFIGAGFMIVEVVLIQRYTLFIGPSSYTFVAILFSLLAGSGIGSFYTAKIKYAIIPFIGIAVWLLLDVLIFGNLLYYLGSFTLLPRILITVILLFPLGFFMGMPFPLGTKKAGELIDWGFAVNGAASVFGSSAIMLVSFNFGFTFALICGLLIYLLAGLLLIRNNEWIKYTRE